MKPTLFATVLISVLCISANAQQVTRIYPPDITLRAVSMGSFNSATAVGDSGYILSTLGHGFPATGFKLWHRVPSPFGSSVTVRAVAYAGDTLHGVIGGDRGSMAYSTDGDSSWTAVSIGTSATVRGIAWNRNTKAPVLAAVGDSGMILRSVDQGKSWTRIQSPTTEQLNAISFGTATAGVAVGNDTTILRTFNGGLTWSRMYVPYKFYWTSGPVVFAPDDYTPQVGELKNYSAPINYTGVAMGGTNSIYLVQENWLCPLVMINGVFDTESVRTVYYEYGDSIPLQPPWGFRANHSTGGTYLGLAGWAFFGSTLNDALNLYGGGDEIHAHLYYTGNADGGVDAMPLRMFAIASWREDTTVESISVGENLTANMITETPVNGPSSVAILFAPGGRDTSNFDMLDVNILPNGYGFFVSVNEFVHRTTDGGFSSDTVHVPITHVGNPGNVDSALNCIWTLDSVTAIVAGWNGIILKVTPSGAGFRGVGVAHSERLEAINFPSYDTGIIVGDYGTILQTTDRGETWKSIPNSVSELLRSVAFANDRIGIAVGTNAAMLRTTDEGNTWTPVNNQLSGTRIAFQQVQAFSDGTFFARTDSGQLLRSTDFGVNWSNIDLPAVSFQAQWGDTGTGIFDTTFVTPNLAGSMSFYSSQIGVIIGADIAWSSDVVDDSVFLSYTTNGGATWQQFGLTIWNYNRLEYHWLSERELLIYGISGFIEDVFFDQSGVHATQIDPEPAIQVYPNPTTGDFRIDYATHASGPVTIQLFSEDGKAMGTLFSGTETAGKHEQALIAPQDLHGSFYLRITKDGTSETVPVSLN